MHSTSQRPVPARALRPRFRSQPVGQYPGYHGPGPPGPRRALAAGQRRSGGRPAPAGNRLDRYHRQRWAEGRSGEGSGLRFFPKVVPGFDDPHAEDLASEVLSEVSLISGNQVRCPAGHSTAQDRPILLG